MVAHNYEMFRLNRVNMLAFNDRDAIWVAAGMWVKKYNANFSGAETKFLFRYRPDYN